MTTRSLTKRRCRWSFRHIVRTAPNLELFDQRDQAPTKRDDKYSACDSSNQQEERLHRSSLARGLELWPWGSASRILEMPRDAFPGYDEPVNIEGDPEELLRTLMAPETHPAVEDGIEPQLDG